MSWNRSKYFPCVSLLWALPVANPMLMRVLLFSGKPWGLPKKMSLTQREPLRRDKIRGQNSSLSVVKNGWRVTHPACIYPCNLLETSFTPHGFFTTAGSYFVLYFVFLMSSGRLVGLFTGSPKGSRGNKRTWLPGMAASQTYKGRHKEAFCSFNLLNICC